MLIAIILIVAAFVVGYFVGRNNPNIAAVNKLIAAGKLAADTTGKIVSVIKKV